jgi:hypothetical protein
MVRKMTDIRHLNSKYTFKDLQKEKEEMRRGWEDQQNGAKN